MKRVQYLCESQFFRPVAEEGIEAFDVHKGDNARRLFRVLSQLPTFTASFEELAAQFPPDDDTWLEYAILRDGEIVSRAAIWKREEDAWEVAAVVTAPAFRGQGFATRMVSHTTAKILGEGKQATCVTGEDNYAMRGVLEKLGFRERDAG